MIYQNFPNVFAFGHRISANKKIFCDFSRAQINFWGHEWQQFSEILFEKFLAVHALNI